MLAGMLAGWEHTRKFRCLNPEDTKAKEYAEAMSMSDKVVGSAIMNEIVAKSFATK